MAQLQWDVHKKGYNSSENRKNETLFTLANGYRGLRGSLEFSTIGEKGNFIAGVFDKAAAQVTEIVNCPDPISLNIYVEDELIDLDRCEVLDFNRRLNMKEGVLYSYLKARTRRDKIIEISSERFVSRCHVHRWAAKYKVVPVNFKGKIFVENIIDGTMTNSTSDPMGRTKHFEVKEVYDLNPGIALKAVTIDKKIEIVEGTLIKFLNDEGYKSRKYTIFGEKVREVFELFVEEGKEINFVKYGTTYSSRDTKNVFEDCSAELKEFANSGFERELDGHKAKWDSIWNNIDIQIQGDDEAQLGIRFNLYHLASSAYDGDERVSLAAKALHGEGYKGHVFWDTETFMLPFFIYTMPDVAKALLMYRYNTLKGARANAGTNGFKGAQFPWESADDGTEVTPKWGFDYEGNPVRIWTGDEEYHINSDITFGIWEYYRASKDKEFMMKYGIEMFFDTAKFWESRVEYNQKYDRYEINKVIGPDEFHEHIDNNVYTNYLAKWSVRKSLELAEWLKNEDKSLFDRLIEKLELTSEDFKQWKLIEEKIYIPRSEDGKLIEQFEGYFGLEHFEITEYDENSMPVWPKGVKLDRLGETQLIKQPDVVMLMIMLGEEFDEETKKENYRYYEERTMHKSSLSPSMYSIMGLAVGDTQNSYKYFMKTIMTDLEDNQGNAEFGLHAASTGGSWQSAVFGFGGLSVDKADVLNLNPWIPERWESMSFNINWKEAKINVKISQKNVEVFATNPSTIKVYGKEYSINKNEKVAIER